MIISIFITTALMLSCYRPETLFFNRFKCILYLIDLTSKCINTRMALPEVTSKMHFFNWIHWAFILLILTKPMRNSKDSMITPAEEIAPTRDSPFASCRTRHRTSTSLQSSPFRITGQQKTHPCFTSLHAYRTFLNFNFMYHPPSNTHVSSR